MREPIFEHKHIHKNYMKIKNITVEIKPLQAVLKEAAGAMGAIKKGKRMKSRKGLSFGSIESFREFFTPKRIQLLQVIRHQQPSSIYEIAHITHRDIKNISVDLQILDKFGLITKKKIPVKGKTGYKIMPIFDYDRLTVDIAM